MYITITFQLQTNTKLNKKLYINYFYHAEEVVGLITFQPKTNLIFNFFVYIKRKIYISDTSYTYIHHKISTFPHQTNAKLKKKSI